MEPRGRQIPCLARTADTKFHQVREALRARPCSGLSAKALTCLRHMEQSIQNDYPDFRYQLAASAGQ